MNAYRFSLLSTYVLETKTLYVHFGAVLALSSGILSSPFPEPLSEELFGKVFNKIRRSVCAEDYRKIAQGYQGGFYMHASL
jgi:hypothetical protein